MLTTVLELAIGGIFLSSLYILVAVGISLLYGVSQTINLAHGDFMIVGAYLMFVLITALGLVPTWVLVVVPILMGALGLILYRTGGFSRILTRPISRGDREFTTMIMTFALAWVTSNLLAWVFTANVQAYPSLAGQVVIGDLIVPIRKLIVMAVAWPLIGALGFMVKTTRIGLSIRCVFDDSDASKLMGIDVNRVHSIIFVLAFLTAGLGGALFSMNFAFSPYLGIEFTILGIVVTIIGGVGSIKGALVGGLIVGLSESFVMFFISPLLKIAFIYTLFITILLIKPVGLFRSM
jgi:branched-chain amino acid transport system permease protein